MFHMTEPSMTSILTSLLFLARASRELPSAKPFAPPSQPLQPPGAAGQEDPKMSNKISCPCPTGVVPLTSTGTSPFLRKSKSARLLLSFALVFGVMLFANAIPAFAQGCQASASLPMSTSAFNIVAGQTKTISVRITNTSSTADFVTPVAANLTGTTVVKLNCANNTCSTSFGTTPLIFVPQGANGCLANDPGVTSCTAGAGNTVNININSIALAPGEALHFVASIQVQANVAPTCAGTIFEPGATGASDVVTNSASCAQQVTGSAGGGTSENFPIICRQPTECEESLTCNPATNVCDVTNKQTSTACADTDNNDCTTAGCDGNGACDQAHIPLTSTPCDDVAGTECADPGCSSGVCVADHFPKDSSTACTDTDNNECTTAGCDGSGGCDQNHVLVPNSTACTDTDQIACTTAGCDGAGNCDQNHIEDCATGQGCTPGFWKANFDKKGANAWPTTNVLLGSVFTIPACLDCDIDFANLTLRQALDLQGGKDACGKAEILLRAAAAAYLNSLSTCVQFELSTGELVAEVNAALANCDATAIITEATRLDGFNNAGCPLNQQGQCSNP